MYICTYEANTTSLPEGLIDIAPTPLSTLIDIEVPNVHSVPSPTLAFMAFGWLCYILGV